MVTNFATTADLAARSLRPLSDVELDWGAVRLDDALAQIVATVPTVGYRLDTPAADPGFVSLVVQVQCAMVLRVLQNPDGILEESGDDYTRRLDASVSTGALYLTPAEERILTADTSGGGGAFTVRPTPVDAGILPDGWFPGVTTDTWTLT